MKISIFGKTSSALGITLLVCSAFGAPYTFISKYKTNYVVDPKAEYYTYDNLPPYKSQDGMENCFSYSAGAYLDMMNCKYNHTECRNIRDEDSFSRIDLGRFGKYIDPKDKDQAFKGIWPDGTNDMNSIQIIENVMHNKKVSVASEKCISLDKILTTTGESSEAFEKQVEAWDNLKHLYDRKKKKCTTCEVTLTSTEQNEIVGNFNIKTDEATILKAFAEDTYSKFLERLLIPKECQDKANAVTFKQASATKMIVLDENEPADKLAKESPNDKYNKALKTIKENLAGKNPSGPTPILIQSICLNEKYSLKKGCTDDPKTNTPASYHALVVTGYRRICSETDKNDCRDSIRVFNSWGATWQQETDGGWVDAKDLLDRTGYIPGSMAWIENKTVK